MSDKRISQLVERTAIENNDVLPIVALGASTTNKVTITTIEDYMQANLDMGVTSVGLTKTGDALAITGSPITSAGNINIAFAGTSGQYVNGAGNLVTFPTLTGYVPYTGATTNVNLGEFGLTAGYYGFDLTPTGTPTGVGTMYWDTAYRTISLIDGDGDTTLQIGQEQRALVHNNTGATLTDGQVVYVTGSTGNLPSVALASNNLESSSSVTFGVVTEAIPQGADGFVTISGNVSGLNTLAFNEGDALYLGSTPGTFTNVKPVAPANLVLIGYMIKKAGGNGSIFVKIQNGYELEELHDVLITSVANNQGLFWDSATSLWKNKSIATALGYTPANAARNLTINGTTYDLTADRTWNVGTVTSVGLSAPTGFSVTGSPVTGSGTLGLSFAAGYSLPTNIKQGNWDDAYTFVTNFPTQTGNAGKFLSTNGSVLSWETVIAGVQSVTASSPLFSSGGANPNITIQQATTSQSGFLSSTDWNTFNSKENAITAGTTAQYYRGDKTFQTLNTTAVAEGTNLYYTDARSRGALSFTAGSGGYNATTGVITIPTNTDQLTNGAGFITSTSLSGYLPLTAGSSNKITGDLYISSNEPQIWLSKTGTDAGSWRILGSTGGDLRRFRVFDNVAEADRFVVFSSGNVGINTTTDAGYKLDVNGTSRFSSGISLSNNNVPPTGAGIYQGVNTVQIVSGSSGFTINNDANSLVNFRVSNTGVTTLSGALNGTSATFSGQVGIGTDTPYAKNDIFQSVAGYGGWKYALNLGATDYPALRFLATTGNTGSIIAHEAGSLLFLTGTTSTTAGATRLTIASTGAATFSSSLEATSASTASSLIQQWSYNSAPVAYRLQLNTIVSSGLVKYSFDLTNNSTAYTNNLVLDRGKVGINTNAPTEMLDINSSTDASFIRLQGTGGGGVYIGNRSDNMELYAGGAERVRLVSGGNVLVGTITDAGYKLSVNGSGYFSSDAYIDGGTLRMAGASEYNWMIQNFNDANWGFGMFASGTQYYPTAYFAGDGTNQRGFRVRNVNAGGSNVFLVDSNGVGTFTGQVYAQGFYESSDMRLKTIIEDNYLVNNISNVKAKLYDKNGVTEVGYYAQDLQEILPSAVTEGNDGFLSLSYSQVHTAKIAYLEDKIAKLEKLIKTLL